MKYFWVFHITLLVFSPFFVFAENSRQALVIGNGGYRHIDSLPNTANDASGVAEKLTALGYDVALLLDGDLAGMTRALGAWIKRLSLDRSSEGFFWYAGHGVQVAGENYLLPVDIKAEDEAGLIYGSYPLGRILLSLEDTARNKLNLVILDACRDNPFKNLPGGSRGLSRGFVTVEHPPPDIFVMFSTAPGTTAADGEKGRNSPFAEAFLKYMDSGEILPVMAGLVTRETMRLTDGKQRPYQNGSIVSDLYYSLGTGNAVSRADNSSGPPAVRNPPSVPGGAKSESTSPVMTYIPSGTFMMGSPSLELDRTEFGERRHEVWLNGFYIAPKELTAGEFRRFVEETGYTSTAEAAGGALVYNEANGETEFIEGVDWLNPGFRQESDHPVVAVSWLDAVLYCNWLSAREGLRPAYIVSGENVSWDRSADGYRLPTEAEWEYACRAGTTTPFFTGERISTSQANYNGNFPYNYGNKGLFRKGTSPAGSFPPNAWGIHDMHGNVWEWCWDFFGYFREEDSAAKDPAGPASGTRRINRGGSWASRGVSLRSAARSSDLPETAGNNLGFRLARNGG